MLKMVFRTVSGMTSMPPLFLNPEAIIVAKLFSIPFLVLLKFLYTFEIILNKFSWKGNN